MTKDKVFMSHMGKRIWYTKMDNGDVWYMVAKGDGTDELFADWRDAMKWIEQKKQKKAAPKLIDGHFYRFNDRGQEHIGQYLGSAANGEDGFECVVCGFGHRCRVFNLWYDPRCGYETWGFGSAHFPEILEDLGEPETPIMDV